MAGMNLKADFAAAPAMPSFLAEFANLKRLQTDRRIEMFLVDQIGGLFGDLLDLDAAFGAGHQDRLGGGAVQHDSEIQLAGDIAARFDKDLVDRLALGDQFGW